MKHVFSILIAFAFCQSSASEYFFMAPQGLTSKEGWTYKVPNCNEVISMLELAFKKCEKAAGRRTCVSRNPVGNENTKTKEKRQTKLVFHIFDSEDICDQERANYLKNN